MKSKMFLALILLAGLSAQAGNEGPHAVIGKAPVVLAEVRGSGGLRPPSDVIAWGTRLYQYGAWVNFTAYSHKPEKLELLATLSPELTAKLTAEFAAIQAGKLVDEKAGEPLCTDTPTTNYSVIQAGQPVAIARSFGCHQSVSESPGAARAVGVLETLEGLSGIANGIDVPEGDVSGAAPTTLGEVSVGGGLRPPTAPTSTGVRVLTSGQIESYVTYLNPSQSTLSTDATLSPQVTAALRAMFAAIVPGKLVETNPGQPGCYDAPSTVYNVHAGDVAIRVGQQSQCKWSQLETDGADAAVRALETIYAIGSLSHRD